MSMSIGTSTPPTTLDTHAAWLRRREDDKPFSWAAMAEATRREPVNSLQVALV